MATNSWVEAGRVKTRIVRTTKNGQRLNSEALEGTNSRVFLTPSKFKLNFHTQKTVIILMSLGVAYV